MSNRSPHAQWLLSFLCAFWTASPTMAEESISVFDYLNQRAARMSAELPPLPQTADQWEKSRGELIRNLSASLGLPDREPMKAEVLSTSGEGDRVLEEVAYHWSGQTYASATVIRGKESAGRRPAILMPSGYLGHHTFLPYRSFVERMAAEGFLVLFIDDPRAGRRHAPYAGLYATASAAGVPVAGIQVFDVLRGLDYLLTRSDVDPGRIGIAGLSEGAVQSYLAAAVEPRLQFVIAIGGTTTWQALVKAAAGGTSACDPSAYVPGILEFADLDRVAACLAPRPVFIGGPAGTGPAAAEGYAQTIQTMKSVYRLCGDDGNLHEAEGGPTDEMGPYAAEVARWLHAKVLSALPSSNAEPLPCGKPEGVNYSVLRAMQQSIDLLAASRPSEPVSEAAWQEYRGQVVDWLGKACGLDRMKPAADKVVETGEDGEVVMERILLGVDAGFECPAVLIRPSASGPERRAGVILSHDARQSAASPRIAEAARKLAAAGYWVAVPEHSSVDPQSSQPLSRPDARSFYGDEASRLYGPADLVGLPPVALRVRENLAAFRHLAGRSEVDPQRLIVAGLGLGGVDASMTAALETRIAGAAAVDATTVRDWSKTVAPGEIRFFQIMPYLPSMLVKTDLDALYAAVAPRPLVLVRLVDGWPRSGFEQVAATTSAVYRLCGSQQGLTIATPRELTEEVESAAEGARKPLIAAARALMPTPPPPGLAGNPTVLKPRATVDSAAGLIWLIAEMSGYEQSFTGGGFRLRSWSFVNDNGAAQAGRVLTPLLFKKSGDQYELVAIGKPRTNTGAGLQKFDFEPVEGTDLVDEGFFFGWHDGDPAGKANPGVVEFEDAPDALMSILTGDGEMSGQKLRLGAKYRVQSQFRRQYSIMAEAKTQ